MATAKKTAAKKPAAKKVAAKRAPAKTAAKKPAARKPAAKVAKKSAAVSRQAKSMKKELSLVAGHFLANGRHDIDALLKVNKHSYKELQALVKRRTSLLKGALKEWQQAAKKVDVAKLEVLGKEAFQMALDNIRQLADLAAKSQNDAFKIVKKNIEGNVSEVSKLLKKK